MLSIDDQLAIQTLYATYNQSVDRDRVDATVACFTLRGALVVGESATEGHEELTAFFHARAASQATLPFRNAQHWNANLLLEEIGDAVRGSCYMVRFAIERESGEKQVVSLGSYEDEIVKHEGRWLFARRTFECRKRRHRC